MEERFIGRNSELKSIKNFFNSENSRAALIYGRRRIGKTELLKHALKNSNFISIYYECKETSEENNVSSLGTIVSETLSFPPLAFSNFEQILNFIYNQTENKEIILILDEYSYLEKVVKGLNSIIQSFIDNHKKSKLKIVLCGSYIETMESLLEKQNPLFGRFDLIINLKAMDYYDSALFYKDFSNEDKVRLYSVFGGIPYYNRLVDSSKTVKENIINLIASNGSRLENEVSMYLRSEISKMTNAYEVFETLSKGYVRFADILSQSNVSSSPALADILAKLIKMEVVKKESPINDENNKKKSGYYISDQLSLFYFKYVYRNLSRLNVMNSDIFYEKFINEDFENQFVPKSFENVCKEFLIRKNRNAELKNPFEKIGKYYYDDAKNKKNGEFDIVTENNGEYIFYEAKFRNTPLDKAEIEKEINQVNETGFICKKYGFFSKSGFKDLSKSFSGNLILFTLDDLFE